MSARFRPDLLAPLLRDLALRDAPGEIVVRGDSMRPALFSGDRLRLVPATAEDARIGCVVVWLGETGPVTHRVVGRWRSPSGGPGGWRLLTKGDAAPRLDPPLSGDRILARAVARVRGGALERLDGAWGRLAGCGRAALSLVEGLIVEAWDRACRAMDPRVGRPAA